MLIEGYVLCAPSDFVNRYVCTNISKVLRSSETSFGVHQMTNRNRTNTCNVSSSSTALSANHSAVTIVTRLSFKLFRPNLWGGGEIHFFYNAAILNNCGMEETRKQLTSFFFLIYLLHFLVCLLLAPHFPAIRHYRHTAQSRHLATFWPCLDRGSPVCRFLTTEP